MPAFTPDKFIVEETVASNGRCDRTEWISEAGGLTQFGAFIETLQPGSHSSLKHWHRSEDEMVYVLEGKLTLVEGDVEVMMRPGDAATFAAGVAVGHCLQNRSSDPAKYLVVGTRSAVDTITYPDHDRRCHRDRAEPEDVWTTIAGEPISGV